MKRILTSVAALLLIVSMLFAMASCGANMDDIGFKLSELEDEGKITYDYQGESDVPSSQPEYTQMYIVENPNDDDDYLVITEFTSSKFAKLAEKMAKVELEYDEKKNELEDDYDDALEKEGFGERYDDDDENYDDYVVKRKGKVLIIGTEYLYKLIF